MKLGDVMRGLAGPRKVDPPTLYRQLMDRHLKDDRETMPRRKPTPGDRSTYTRVSSLGKLCARKDSMQITQKKVILASSEPQYEMAREIGHAFHSMLQDSVVPRMIPERILGWWRVPHGEKLAYVYDKDGRPKLFTRAQAVDILGTDNVLYYEVEVVDHEYMITGHPDMIVDWTGIDVDGVPDGLEVQEFKTVDPLWWDKLDPHQGGAPDESYVVQLQTYMWLLGIPRGRLIFFKKGERRPEDGIIEYAMTSDPDTTSQVKKLLTNYWDGIYAAHSSGKVDEHKPCPKWDRFPATWCAFRHECFGRNRRKAAPHRDMTPEEIEEWKR